MAYRGRTLLTAATEVFDVSFTIPHFKSLAAHEIRHARYLQQISAARRRSAHILSAIALFAVVIGGCNASKLAPDAKISETPLATPVTVTPSTTASAAPRAEPAKAAELPAASTPRSPASSVSAMNRQAAVSANNAFAVALFAQLSRSRKGENLLTSPISASLALSMATAGAQAMTRAELATALHFGSSSPEAIFAGQNALSQALLARAPEALTAMQQSRYAEGSAPVASDYHLQIVNSIWGQADYPWEATFLRRLGADYGTRLNAVDFRTQAEPVRIKINDWVSSETGNKINDLIPSKAIDDSTRMVLVNALHLKLPWANAFSPSDTAPAAFTHGDGKKSSPKFMHRQAQYAYRDDGQAQIIGLPLAGEQLTVLVALPHAGVSLERYKSALSAGSAALTRPEGSKLVALSLPKVDFTSETFSLLSALRALGVRQAFDREKADFSGMCQHIPDGFNLYVSDVLQKTMIAVQETGVEAAAATAVLVMVAASAHWPPKPPPVPIPMIVNRPYLLSVVDAGTGAILLLGQINDP